MARPTVAVDLERAANRLGRARVPSAEDAGRTFAVCARAIRPTLIKMLETNLRAAGIKKGKGNLAEAVRSTVVWVSKGKLRWAFSRQIDDEVHRYGNALNYGSVRQPRPVRVIHDLPSNNIGQSTRAEGILGARAKKTLKAQMLGYSGQSHRADTWRQGRTNRARGHAVWMNSRQVSQNVKTKSISVPVKYRVAIDTNEKQARVTVTRPRYYYDLSADQAAALEEAFAALVARRMEKQAGKG